MNARRNTLLVATVVALGAWGAATAGADQPAESHVYAPPPAIAAYANSHVLTGLSPASLAPVPLDRAAADDTARQIADYAGEHGLSGLSPASLSAAGG